MTHTRQRRRIRWLLLALGVPGLMLLGCGGCGAIGGLIWYFQPGGYAERNSAREKLIGKWEIGPPGDQAIVEFDRSGIVEIIGPKRAWQGKWEVVNVTANKVRVKITSRIWSDSAGWMVDSAKPPEEIEFTFISKDRMTVPNMNNDAEIVYNRVK